VEHPKEQLEAAVKAVGTSAKAIAEHRGKDDPT
jgi:hypothetical protein